MIRSDEDYRPGVGMVIARPQRMVFAGRRIKNSSREAWQLPQGGIDAGEETLSALWRELTEETGIQAQDTRIVAKTDWLYYDIPDSHRRKLWQGRYIGQRQKWFLLELIADDSAVQLSNPGAPPEFDTWKWVPFDHIDAMVVEFKRDLYRQVQKAFKTDIDQIV